MTTTGALQPSYRGGVCAPGDPCPEAFVTKLQGATEALSYSTYLGGSGGDAGTAIAVDTAGHAYVTGQTASADVPTRGTLQGFGGVHLVGPGATGTYTTSVAFVARLNTQGTGLWYSSYLGGSGGDAGTGGAVDGSGAVYLTGQTGSSDVRATTPWAAARATLAGQATPQGNLDGYVATLDATTRRLVYGYDGVDRLAGVTETLGAAYSYTYDRAGDRLTVGRNGVIVQQDAYNAASAVVTQTTPQSGTVAVGYDAAGNLSGDGTSAYGYDALDRLVTLSVTATGHTESAAYNGDGTLETQTRDGVATQYTQDLAGSQSGAASPPQDIAGNAGASAQGGGAGLTQVLATTQGTGAPTDDVYGQAGAMGAGRLASLSGGRTTRSWPVADLQGSARYTQDDTGGSGSALTYDPVPQRYDPYGAIDRGADGDGTQPATFGYRGEPQDAATGLIYLRARLYNPASGQFLTRDPLAQQTGQPYAYAGGDPVNNSDPGGQASGSGYVEVSPVVNDPLVEKSILQAVRDDFIAHDRSHLSFPGPTYDIRRLGINPGPADPTAGADLVTLSPRVKPNGHYGGEVYDFVPDVYQYYHTAPPISEDGSPNSQLTGQLNRLVGIAYGVGLGSICKHPVDLRFGTHYPLSFGDFEAGRQGTSNPLISVFTPQGLYLTFGRYLSPGFVGVSLCRRAQDVPGNTQPCHEPVAPLNVCSLYKTTAGCLIDQFIYAGSVLRLEQCGPNDTACHVLNGIGVVAFPVLLVGGSVIGDALAGADNAVRLEVAPVTDATSADIATNTDQGLSARYSPT